MSDPDAIMCPGRALSDREDKDEDMGEDEFETYKLDADERRLQRIDRVRATVAPEPKHLRYPAPWRVAEQRAGHVVVVCADGSYTAECPNFEAAEAIVLAVNTFAGVSE